MNYFESNSFFSSPFWQGAYFTAHDFYKSSFFGNAFGGGTTPAPSKPAKVGTITETGVTKTEIQLDWSQVANAANYNVDVTPAVTGFPKDISVNTLALTGLTAATAYTIKIKACNVAGCATATTKTVTTAT